jgi:predicted DNA-binding protein YlxM (UPF0122 family)
MKMFEFKKVLLTAALSTQVFATYLYDDPNLGNIAIEGGIWNTAYSGNIKNTKSVTDLEKDLGYKENKNITTFGLNLKNNYTWIPNIYINYLHFKDTADGTLSESKSIGLNKNNTASIFSNSVSTSTEYSEVNAIFYGYLQQSIFQFDLGLNFKDISYEQIIKENSDTDKITIKGPDKIFVLPYIALSVDLDSIDTVLKAEGSIVSLGDDEAHDYRYSINYRVMRHMYLSYGYKFHSWTAKSLENEHEEYKVELKGHYINAKILF